MSGDRTPRDYVAGVAQALREDPAFHGRCWSATRLPSRVRSTARCRRPAQHVDGRVEIVPATEVVAMDDSPREAIRRKKHSSMRLAIDVVKEGRALACVSAGNTGALTAMSHFVLKTLEGVERAAIMSAIPAAHGHTHMLDLGANTKATPEQLLQFGSMGSIVARDVYGASCAARGVFSTSAKKT